MVAVSVLVVLFVSLLIARIGTVALTVTGMSREAARFQAQSAFFGVGYTTTEAESVVSHPVRRRIIMAMILAGNAGVITTVGTLLLSFDSSDDTWTTVAVLAGGILVLGALALSRPVDRVLTRVIRRALARWTASTCATTPGCWSSARGTRWPSWRWRRRTGSRGASSAS
jgi:hypothetical protein